MPGQRTRPYFRAPTCVLKGSDDDDVEDRRHDPCCASDGGRSSGVAVQAEIPNHRRLRRSRAGVVSAAVDVSLLAGRVCDEKTNMCEPLLTHRNETTMASKLGSVGGPGTKARLGGPSVGELPVCGPGGARCIGGVSSSQALAWNRRTCRPDRDGRRCWPREGEPQAADTASARVPMRGVTYGSKRAGGVPVLLSSRLGQVLRLWRLVGGLGFEHGEDDRGGPARSSGEGPVMGSERRGRAVHGRVAVNPSGEEPTDRPRQKNAGLWEPYDGRLSRTVLRERDRGVFGVGLGGRFPPATHQSQ